VNNHIFSSARKCKNIDLGYFRELAGNLMTKGALYP
jgi:hypothetical protein